MMINEYIRNCAAFSQYVRNFKLSFVASRLFEFAKMASEFVETLTEQLKCQICECGPKAGKSRWYKCTAMHQICQDCKEVNHVCNCKEKICGSVCKVIEALLNVKKMRFTCENHGRGCQESSGEENIIFHQTECIYRLVNCPRITCESKVPFHEVLDHVRDLKHFHGDEVLVNGSRKRIADYISKPVGSYTHSGFNLIPKKLEMKDRIFFSTAKLKDRIFYHWIHFVGSPNEAKNYVYTLEYIGNDNRSCSYTGPVTSIDEPSDSLISKGHCHTITQSALTSTLFKDDKNFDYYVKITNMKEEVKDQNVESGISDDE